MITVTNTQRVIRLNKKQVERIAAGMLAELNYGDFDLGITFTGTKAMQTYNRTYRNKDKVTDILSFPYHENLKPGKRIKVTYPEDKNLGDLIICPLYVRADAIKLWEQTFDERLVALIAHGIAHLLGHDHETDADYAVMSKLEARLIKASSKF